MLTLLAPPPPYLDFFSFAKFLDSQQQIWSGKVCAGQKEALELRQRAESHQGFLITQILLNKSPAFFPGSLPCSGEEGFSGQQSAEILSFPSNANTLFPKYKWKQSKTCLIQPEVWKRFWTAPSHGCSLAASSLWLKAGAQISLFSHPSSKLNENREGSFWVLPSQGCKEGHVTCLMEQA